MKRDRANRVAELAERYGRVVFAAAYRILGHADDAEVLALRYFEDFSYKEIAGQMRLSVDQVGVILHRGRRPGGRPARELLADRSTRIGGTT